MIKIGCCGFRGKRQDYFKNFQVVEIQQTFYKPPMLNTARKWRQEAPPNFEYTMKAWQLITHEARSPTYRKAGLTIEEERKDKYGFFRPTKEVFEAWEKCMEFARELNARIIVFQCPPAFKENIENIENMRQFFSSIEKKFLYALELRAEWRKEIIVDICEEFGLIHCVDPFKNESYYGEPKYYRLHGMKGYNYDYSVEELQKLLKICKGREVYCLFNNTQMLKNALEFKKLLKK